MTRIRIIKCPPGEAPLSVRLAWVGLELPVAPGRGRPRTWLASGVLSTPRGWWQRVGGLFTGRYRRQTGYAVNALEAVNLLARRQAHLRREHGREGDSGVQPGRKHAAGHRSAHRGQRRPGGHPHGRQVSVRGVLRTPRRRTRSGACRRGKTHSARATTPRRPDLWRREG